ncbi:GMC family oxidoreductase N-terminal domain-containing protein [Roseateles amylovorans]|uniref:Cholesterol oxidase n=1 Tax=Roseateles amylovorans TaxID=2978473 RepID=A0ABY6B0D3_9BURK|nr:GMC family oxidoreductase N-terminal domain-containing protein [Roseateles amylovorans]UXH78854.1 GMC family oxidoreductase N-terminal domain-containing protein [Roseateles amylovorans]
MAPPFEEARPAPPERPSSSSSGAREDARPFGTRWLSRPLEDWMAERLQGDRRATTGESAESAAPEASGDPVDSADPVDLLIVGSGYGGAAAAHAFAGRCDAQGRPLRVVVLERGREYLPGAFPSRFADLPGHVRFASRDAESPTGRREGLFDLRLGPDVCVALANGLGGGSLINAGVMERPTPTVFTEPGWPETFLSEDLSPWFDRAERLLGVRDDSGDNTIERLRGHRPRRLALLRELGGSETRAARLQVAMDTRPRGAAQWSHQACLACGDCATGCNHEAKQSLDTGLLLQAWRAGAELICGASVERLERAAGGGWAVHVQHTDELLRRRQGKAFVVKARRVILAAGSLGSTEILLRSKRAGLPVSHMLGQRFSANGDVLAVGQALPEPLHAVADEQQPAAERQVGPTITAVMRGGADFVVEDLAVPGALRPLFEESFALAGTLDALGRPNTGRHEERAEFDDPFAVRPHQTERYLPMALIGRDSGTGALVLNDDSEEPGCLGVAWPGLRHEPDIARRHAWIERRLQQRGARLLRNPMWQLLPPEMAFLMTGARGPMISVHPLGGCAMADRGCDGVVNPDGQVFVGAGDRVHEDLVVLDGAIVPTSLAINPALTITALALRALAHLTAKWDLNHGPGPVRQERVRPRFRRIEAPKAETPTVIEVRERLGGFVRWPGAPGSPLKYLELGFVYQPKVLTELLRPGPERRLVAAPGSFLRVYEARETPSGRFEIVGPRQGDGRLWWHQERGDGNALFTVPLKDAELAIFQREASGPLRRHARGLAAWVMNRGYRDSVQGALDWLSQRTAAKAPDEPSSGVWARIVNAWHLSGHAGEVRLMRYRLRIDADAGLANGEPLPDWANGLREVLIQGRKRISYTRRGNPWTQLSRLILDPVAGLQPPPGQREIRLELDLHHLARERMPLLRIRQAQDSPTAVRDIGALMAYIARMTIGLHAWTFRKPDEAPPRRIDRLPGAVPDLPTPTVIEMAAGRWGEAGAQRQDLERRARDDDDRPVLVRLTRYARPGGEPVLMIHGYSASGTTFAHHSVRPGPAKILWDAGYDVWIVDMRTSAGLPTAKLPWTFEESAFNDIPLAVDRVLRETGREQLHVFAHCMGSVMLHMAMLEPRQQPWEHFFPLRQRLMSRVSKLVISQVTPLMVMSPTNSLRGVLMQYLRPYLPLSDFAFRPEGPPTLMDQVMDRLLSSLPYPDAEFDVENPPPPRIRRTPWTAARHRMDLLYGRDFAVTNVGQPVLDFIDDHFGPLNMDTVAQAVHFARCHEITDWQGASVYLDSLAKSLAMLRAFPVLSLHGEDNGLCSAESAELLRDYYEQAAPGRYHYRVIAGHGHQDCLIGRDIQTRVFPAVLAFLAEGGPSAPGGEGRGSSDPAADRASVAAGGAPSHGASTTEGAFT